MQACVLFYGFVGGICLLFWGVTVFAASAVSAGPLVIMFVHRGKRMQKCNRMLQYDTKRAMF
jgi:hypothetical protein